MDEFKIVQRTKDKKKRTVFYNNNAIVISLTYDLNKFIDSYKEIITNRYKIANNKNVTILPNNIEDFKRLLIMLSLLSRTRKKEFQTKSIIMAFNLSKEEIDYWYKKIIEAYKDKKLIGTFRIIKALKVMLGIE